MTAQPSATMQCDGSSVEVMYGGRSLARYVFLPDSRDEHAPKPYLAPIRSLAGEDVTIVQPHDHPWHNGVQLALPHVGACNLWGGPTYVAGRGYQDLSDNGQMRHLGFERASADGALVTLVQKLSWRDRREHEIADETRSLTFDFSLASRGVWRLGLRSAATNRTGQQLRFSSPAIEGRGEAGYGGWTWRGPRSFTGGRFVSRRVLSDWMGASAPWLAFVGRHDGSGATTTVVMRAEPADPTTRWFARREPYAMMGTAPFYERLTWLDPDSTLHLACDLYLAEGRLSDAQIEALWDEGSS